MSLACLMRKNHGFALVLYLFLAIATKALLIDTHLKDTVFVHVRPIHAWGVKHH